MEFKNQLSYQKLDYSSVLSLCESFPQIITIQKRQKSTDWVMHDPIIYEVEFWSTFEKTFKEETRERSQQKLEALPYIDIVTITLSIKFVLYIYFYRSTMFYFLGSFIDSRKLHAIPGKNKSSCSSACGKKN